MKHISSSYNHHAIPSPYTCCIFIQNHYDDRIIIHLHIRNTGVKTCGQPSGRKYAVFTHFMQHPIAQSFTQNQGTTVPFPVCGRASLTLRKSPFGMTEQALSRHETAFSAARGGILRRYSPPLHTGEKSYTVTL